MALRGVTAFVVASGEDVRNQIESRLEGLEARVHRNAIAGSLPRITHVVVTFDDVHEALHGTQSSRWQDCFVVDERWLEVSERLGRRAIELKYLLYFTPSERRLSSLPSPSPGIHNLSQSQETYAIQIPGVRSASPWEAYGPPSQLSPSPQVTKTRARLRDQVDAHLLGLHNASSNGTRKRTRERSTSERKIETVGEKVPEKEETLVEVDGNVAPGTRCPNDTTKEEKKNHFEHHPPPYKSQRQKGVIALSALEHSFKKQLVASMKILKGFKLVESIEESSVITHLILGEEKRTAKALMGIVSGAWCLKSSWITDSEAAGRWLDEKEYIFDGQFSESARKARERKSKASQPDLALGVDHLPPLSNDHVSFYGGNQGTRMSLKQIAIALGCTVTTMKKCDISIWCGDLQKEDWPSIQKTDKCQHVHKEWLLKSAQDYKRQPLELFQHL